MSLAMLALAVFLSTHQTAHQAFAGTWTAVHRETTFVRLELRVADGKVEGKIRLGNIRVDGTGAVEQATEAPGELKPIFDVALKGSTLSFAAKDDSDTDRFEVTLVGADVELRFVLSELDRRSLAAEGIPVPQPIRLTKVGR